MDSARLSMPDTLMVLQERVRQRDALVLEQAKVLAEKNEAITRLTKDLQERIGHGLSTGDRLRDLVLAAHGYDPMLEEKYRELEDTLQGKKGEFVLISWQKMVRAYGPRDDMRSVSLYRLGVLEDEKVIPCIAKDLGPFTLHGSVLTLPISRFVAGDLDTAPFRGARQKTDAQKKNIFAQVSSDSDPPFLGLHVLQEVRPHPRVAPSTLEIIVGDEPVKEWLRKHLMEGLYKPAAYALSKLILEPTEG